MLNKTIVFLLLATFAFSAFAQEKSMKTVEFSARNITTLEVINTWGKIIIEPGENSDKIVLSSKYDNASGNDLDKGNDRLITKTVKDKLLIEAPNPAKGTFESYDLSIKVPERLHLVLKMERGGDIFVKDIIGSIQVDNQNGSTSVDNAASWVTINNFNEEIKLSYQSLEKVKAISAITFNGGITLTLPEMPNADAVLKTKKNGFIHSDFPVVSHDGKTYENMPKRYIKSENTWMGRIGKGGVSIIAITNNGPVELVAD